MSARDARAPFVPSVGSGSVGVTIESPEAVQTGPKTKVVRRELWPITLSEQRQRTRPPSLLEYFAALLDDPESSAMATVVSYAMTTLIIGATISTIMETVPAYREFSPIFFPLEMCFTAVFTMEFAFRLFACASVRAFLSNGFNAIDFLAVFPGYIELAVGLFVELRSHKAEGLHQAVGSMRTLRMIRMLRLIRVVRVLRLAKIARHSHMLNIILRGTTESSEGVMIIVSLVGFFTVLFGSLVYGFEASQPPVPGVFGSSFDSIPSAMWWAVTTLTTVGYGDMVVKTLVGKFIAGIACFVGAITVSVGFAIFHLNFAELYQEEMDKTARKRKRINANPFLSRLEESRLQHVSDVSKKLSDHMNDICNRLQVMLDPAVSSKPIPFGTDQAVKSLVERHARFQVDIQSCVFDFLVPAMEVSPARRRWRLACNAVRGIARMSALLRPKSVVSKKAPVRTKSLLQQQ